MDPVPSTRHFKTADAENMTCPPSAWIHEPWIEIHAADHFSRSTIIFRGRHQQKFRRCIGTAFKWTTLESTLGIGQAHHRLWDAQRGAYTKDNPRPYIAGISQLFLSVIVLCYQPLNNWPSQPGRGTSSMWKEWPTCSNALWICSAETWS